MGIIKPRPLGKVTAVRLAERASLQGSAPHPTKNLFSKRFLELQKLLKMGVMYPPSHDEFTFPPPRRVAPSKENNAAAHSCEHSSRGIISLACPSDKVSGKSELHKRGRGWRSRRPVQTVRYRFDLSSMFADLVGATIGRPSFLRTRNARPYGTRQSFCCANDYI